MQKLFEEALTPLEGAVSSSSMTVAQALERGAAQLDEAADIPQLTRAELHQALAKRFANFQMWTHAEEQAIKAIGVGETLGRGAWAVLVDAYRTRGVVAALRGDTSAVTYSNRSKVLSERVYGAVSAEYATAIAEHAYSGWKVGTMSPDEIEARFRESFELSQTLPGGYPQGSVVALRTLADFLVQQQRAPEAVATLAKAQALLAEVPESEDWSWTLTTDSRATLLFRLGEVDAAESVLTDAIDKARNRDDKLALSRLLWRLGEVYAFSPAIDKPGLSILSQSIDRRLEVVAPELVGGSDLLRWGKLLRLEPDRLFFPYLFAGSYAMVQYHSGQHDQAVALIDLLVETFPEGATSPFVLDKTLLKAEVLLETPKTDQARRTLESVRNRIEALPEHHSARQRHRELCLRCDAAQDPSAAVESTD
jgi:tetratricopeptide (TPR) repeat protein